MDVSVADILPVVPERARRADDVHASGGDLDTDPADLVLDGGTAQRDAYIAVHRLPYRGIRIRAVYHPALEGVGEEHGVAELVHARRVRPVFAAAALEN